MEKLVHSLILGYSKYKGLTLKRPTTSIEYEADLVYEETHQESLSYTIPFSEMLLKLIEHDLWTPEQENRFTELPKLIEEGKVNLYENRTRSETLKNIRRTLADLRSEFLTLFSLRHAYDAYTCEGVANFTKLSSIVRLSVFKQEKLYRFKGDLEEIIQEFQKNTLNDEKLREVARHEVWQGYWTAIKNGIKVFSDLTDEQRKLIRISSFYDSLRQSPDCPPDWVIEDDDMLDGFLISNRKKNEKESNERDLEGTLSDKVKNCSEVYIVCENQEDAQKVYGMNSTYAKAAMGAREKVIAEKGIVNEVDLPDVRKQLLMTAARAGIT